MINKKTLIDRQTDRHENHIYLLTGTVHVAEGIYKTLQTVGIPMGTNCVPLLADLVSYFYEAEFIQKLLHEENKPLAVAFSSTFRYIDDVLSIKNNQFHSYLDSIYSSKLDIKGTTESSTSALYLGVLLNIHAGGNLTTYLYDKRDYFHFAIFNFPYICSNTPLSLAYAYISLK
jgi:hypothetical protein